MTESEECAVSSRTTDFVHGVPVRAAALDVELRRLQAKCDGNHGGPPCGDPECWNDTPAPSASKPSPGRLYVTYGGGTAQRNNYSVVDAPTREEARARVVAVCGSAFANTYDEQEFAGQSERYGLTETPLQPQTRNN